LLKDPSSMPRFSAKAQTAQVDPSLQAPLNAVAKKGKA
jgi:hypothetical protein